MTATAGILDDHLSVHVDITNGLTGSDWPVTDIDEIVALLRQDRAISKSGGLGSGWMRGIRDWAANLWLSIRSAKTGR